MSAHKKISFTTAHEKMLVLCVEQLKDHGETLANHGDTLANHGKMLADQAETLANHGKMLADQAETLAKQGKMLAAHDEKFLQIDKRFDQIDQRFDLIEQRLDKHDMDIQRLFILLEDQKSTLHTMLEVLNHINKRFIQQDEIKMTQDSHGIRLDIIEDHLKEA